MVTSASATLWPICLSLVEDNSVVTAVITQTCKQNDITEQPAITICLVEPTEACYTGYYSNKGQQKELYCITN